MTETEAPPPPASEQGPPAEIKPVRSRVLSAAAWMTAGHSLGQIIRLGSSVVLTRLLFPDVYGLMEIVYVFYTGLNLFSDLGLQPNIVQSKRGEDPKFLNTAWTVQIIRGVILTVASALIAWPVATYYRQPDLALLIPAVGVTALFEGLVSTSLFVAARKVNLRIVVLTEVGVQGLIVVAQVAFALVWPSAWALVVGAWVGALAKAFVSHVFIPSHRHRLAWDREAVRELLRFGSWILGSTALNFVWMQGDRVILGRLLTLTELGVYGIALRLRSAVLSLQMGLIRSVVMPVLAEKNRAFAEDDPERLPQLSFLYYKARLRTDALLVTGTGVMVGFGDMLIRILYTEPYHLAGPILQVLSLQLAMSVAAGSGEAILVALGQTRFYFMQSVARSLVVVLGVPLGWWLFEFWGVVWAMALIEVPSIAILLRELGRSKVLNVRRELLSVVFFAAGILLGWLMKLGVQLAWDAMKG